MAGPFGGSSSAAGPFSGSGASSTPNTGKSSHHGIFHNLLTDAIDTAKGIVPGIVTSVEHPVRAAKGMYNAEKAMYSPLVHGQFGTFWANVHEHPLAPLLDALTVASLGAGGIGLGLKAGEATGLLEQGAADIVRPATEATMRDLPTSLGSGVRHGEIAQHLSTNLFRQVLQRGTTKAFEGAGKLPIGHALFGENGLHDMTPLGRGNRALAQRASQHSAGTAFSQNRELGAVRKLTKSGEVDNTQIGALVNDGIVKSVFAHGIKVDPAKAAHLKGQDWTYIQRVHPVTPPAEGSDLATWADHIKTKSPFTLTKNPAKALKDENGHLTVVHRAVPKAAVDEASNGLRTIHLIYQQPTKLWKYLLLAQAPRYFVNNVLGNSLMLMASTRPDKLVRGVYQAVADVHGTKVAERSARQAQGVLGGEEAKLAGSWYHKWYAGPNAGPGAELARVGKKLPHRLTNGLYDATEKVAYRGTHMAGVNAAIMDTPQFQTAYTAAKAAGHGSTEAFRKAADTASEDPAVRGYVAKKAADWAGQYYHSTPLENFARNVVPFYSWDRHALRFAKEQALGRPGASDVLTHVGAQGEQYVQKKLGNVPDFLKGALPLGSHGGILGAILGGDPTGRKKILLTDSLNPLSAAAEDVNALAAIGGAQVGTKSEALGFQINPLIAGAIESLTGQRLGSGAPVNYKGGVVGGALTNTFGAVPFAKVIESLIHPTPSVTSKGKPTLYGHTTRQQIQSLLGLPVRDMSPEAAAIMLAKASKGKAKKKVASVYG